MKRIFRLITLASIASLPGDVALNLPAQVQTQGTLTLSGTVTDPTGALIPDASVQLAGQGRVQQTRTDQMGRFSFSLAPGAYTVRVTFDGFAPFTSRTLSLKDGAALRLPVRLAMAIHNEQVEVDTGRGASTNPDGNASALTFSGDRLNLLSGDPATLRQQLNALAGPALGGLGPQIMVNGFSGGQVPPKSSIRSISINQNPFSPIYDAPGLGRVDIETKPGGNKLHGALTFAGTDRPMDAPNPYDIGPQAPFYQFQTDGNLNGAFGKNTSFFLAENTQQLGNDAIVNAVVLDATLAPSTISEALPAPQLSQTYSLRLDQQFTPHNFGFIRDEWSRNRATNSGIAPLVLPSAAFTSDTLTDTLQAADTQDFGPHAVNQVRFQYLRTRIAQQPNSTAPAINVQGSFLGGGSVAQTLHDNQDHYEFQDRLEFDHGSHALRFGLRLRELRDANTSSGNFNGEYTFNDIAAYRITQQGLAAGLSAAQIRAAGGGAAQFNLTAGRPSALLYTDDLGVSAEDDWTLSPHLTFSYGLRFESQSAVPDHVDPAPRVGLAWAVPHGKSQVPLVTLRTGYGIFYDRFPAGNLLQAIRQNGSSELAYFVQNPDTFPAVPAPSALSATEPTVYRVNPALRTSYNQVASIGVDRAIGRIGTVSANFLYAHGTHEYLARNLNAPLPGIYNPADPTSGTRPLGNNSNPYQYSSDSNENDELFYTVAQLQFTKKLFLFATYNLQHQASETNGPSSFPSNQYDLRADYAQAATVPRQYLNSVLFWTLPHGFGSSLSFNARSGMPFDITTGTDLNGDTLFNDRPAFATDLTRATVLRTAFGNFDTSPVAGQQTIPRNFGNAPAMLWFTVLVNKDFHLGPRPHAAADASAAPAAASARPDRPWDLKFEAEADNVPNHNNPGPPIGVLTSPYFGHSLSQASDFSPLTASNRTILLRCTLTF